MFIEEDLVLLMVIGLILMKDISLELLMAIVTLATSMGIQLLSAGLVVNDKDILITEKPYLVETLCEPI